MTHATVSGPTDHVIVVGAGLSGLAAALHLRGTGREVTVIEKSDTVGGRVGSVAAPGYRIDTGASVLTMPDLIDQALAAVGATRESTTPPLRLTPLHPAYHTRFADGTTIDVHSDPERMIAEVGEKCGPDEARRYRTLRAWIGSMFDAEFDRYIDDNVDSPLDLVGERRARANTLTLLRLGGSENSESGSTSSSTTRDCAASSPSRLSTPVSRPPKLSGSTPRSRTWTRRWVCRSRTAECSRSRTRWPTRS